LRRIGFFRRQPDKQTGISEPKTDRDAPESLLLARVAKRDREALSEVYTRFQRPLFSYLFHLLGQKELAEDVLQEVIVIIWQKAHTFQGTAPAARWIFGIAHHQAFKALRRDANATFLDLEAAVDIADETLDPEITLLRQNTHEEITRALTALTPEHREVLELAFFQDFTGKEIAAIIGIPLGTVKSRLSYARHALKKALLRNGWEVEQFL
jgi:RNA polymerase sigma-70 factor (ECF subfamily)